MRSSARGGARTPPRPATDGARGATRARPAAAAGSGASEIAVRAWSPRRPTQSAAARRRPSRARRARGASRRSLLSNAMRADTPVAESACSIVRRIAEPGVVTISVSPDEVGGAHVVAGRERVVGRDDQHELLLEEHDAAEVRRAAPGLDEADREVELVGAQQREHLVGGLLAQAQVDAGMGRVEGREQGGRVERPDRRQRTDREAAVHEPAELLQLGDRAVELGERALRAHGQHLARLGQPDAAARAPQQVDAELGLEPADLLGERGLGDVQLAARAREVPLAGDGEERAQLAELHRADRLSGVMDPSASGSWTYGSPGGRLARCRPQAATNGPRPSPWARGSARARRRAAMGRAAAAGGRTSRSCCARRSRPPTSPPSSRCTTRSTPPSTGIDARMPAHVAAGLAELAPAVAARGERGGRLWVAARGAARARIDRHHPPHGRRGAAALVPAAPRRPRHRDSAAGCWPWRCASRARRATAGSGSRRSPRCEAAAHLYREAGFTAGRHVPRHPLRPRGLRGALAPRARGRRPRRALAARAVPAPPRRPRAARRASTPRCAAATAGCRPPTPDDVFRPPAGRLLVAPLRRRPRSRRGRRDRPPTTATAEVRRSSSPPSTAATAPAGRCSGASRRPPARPATSARGSTPGSRQPEALALFRSAGYERDPRLQRQPAGGVLVREAAGLMVDSAAACAAGGCPVDAGRRTHERHSGGATGRSVRVAIQRRGTPPDARAVVESAI